MDKFADRVIEQMFENLLRGVNVYGEWEPVGEGQGGIVYKTPSRTLRWVKGLTWEMFDADLTGFTTVISKTARSSPEPYDFDLMNAPSIRERRDVARILNEIDAPEVGPMP